MDSIKYKIVVHINERISLTFRVTNYEVIEDGRIRFTDLKTGKIKRFDPRLCEIEEVAQDE